MLFLLAKKNFTPAIFKGEKKFQQVAALRYTFSLYRLQSRQNTDNVRRNGMVAVIHEKCIYRIELMDPSAAH